MHEVNFVWQIFLFMYPFGIPTGVVIQRKAATRKHNAESSYQLLRTRFLKLWHAYHYWYTNHCSLAQRLNKNLKCKKRMKSLKKKKHKLQFANIQFCKQRYITHPHCQPVIQISPLLYKYEKFIGGKVKLLNSS